jgi:hypothetical protein
VQRVTVDSWGELAVYGWDEGKPALLSARVPQWLERLTQCRPATLASWRKDLFGPQRPPSPYVAVWPTDAVVPDTRSDGPAWTIADIDGVVLTEYTSLHCFACGRHMPGLYLDTGLPFFEDFRCHPFASGCPLCGADYGESKIRGLMVFTGTTSGLDDTSSA